MAKWQKDKLISNDQRLIFIFCSLSSEKRKERKKEREREGKRENA
jgi:hypothetical protein